MTIIFEHPVYVYKGLFSSHSSNEIERKKNSRIEINVEQVEC